MEVDCYRSLPHDATLHVSRMHTADFAESRETDEEDLDRFVIPAANALGRRRSAHRRVRLRRADGAVRQHMRAQAGGSDRGDDRSGSHRRRRRDHPGLRDTQASRVAVVTPYGDETNRRLAAVLEANGVTVSAMHGMGLSSVEAHRHDV